jgi:hypothetical protein
MDAIAVAEEPTGVEPPAPLSRRIAFRHHPVDLPKISTMAGVLCFLIVCSCGNSAGSSAGSHAPAKIGVNVHTIDYWDGSRPFMNLIYGSDWSMQASGGWEKVPPTNLDASGWIRSLPAGYHAIRLLSMPMKEADIVCRWQGNDHKSMHVDGAVASNFTRRPGTNELTFHYASTYPKAQAWASLSFTVDPSDYVRNIDCREASASSADVFDPTLVGLLKGFHVIRFMKWQTAVEANRNVTWTSRNKPGDGSYLIKDGVPIEQMVQLSNQVGADPWFCIPWNANDDYVARFAAYVREHLAPGRQVYVELGNEVWNGSYPAYKQAQEEGIAEGLDSSQGVHGQAIFRYAEKTQHIMQIWTREFAGQTNRLVRVIAGQEVSPYWTSLMMGYRNTPQYIDAFATGAYWGIGQSDYHGQSLDELMETVLPANISATMELIEKQKAIAQKYGKRYIAYEGGQGVVLDDANLVAQIERDPRMYDLYTSYLNQWNSRVGDTLPLFALTEPLVGKEGWGLVEYAGQPLSDAPKMRAARDFLGRRAQ